MNRMGIGRTVLRVLTTTEICILLAEIVLVDSPSSLEYGKSVETLLSRKRGTREFPRGPWIGTSDTGGSTDFRELMKTT